MTTTNILIKTALDYAYQQDPQFLYYIGRANVEAQLQAALDAVMPDEMTLAQDKPDFEAILYNFVQKLQTDDVWKDTIQAGTGQTLLRNISAGVVYLHFAIVRATQNNLLQPNASKNSVYQSMNYLGVNVRRRVPQKLKCRLTVQDHTDPIIIPAYQQFKIMDINYFNRDPITYTQFDLQKDVILYQGTVFNQEGAAAGIPFETIDIGYENFSISDEDVYVSIDGLQWARDVALRPWMAAEKQKIFFTRTLETGNVQVRFGNNLFAMIPPADSTISITWMETLGADAVQVPTGTNFQFFVDTIPVAGVTLGASYSGDNELDTSFYAAMGPHIRAANEKGVTRPQYLSVALEYPRVRDALIRGQAELNPGKRNWMNIAAVTILTDNATPMSEIEWGEFVAYLQANGVWQLEFIRQDPIIIPIDITANVYCTTQANLADIKSVLTNAIKNYSLPRRGAVGYSIFQSDISGLLEGNIPQSTPRITDYSKQIEYSTDLTFAYSAGFDPSILAAGSGINSEGNIIADYNCYIKINNVDLTVSYTPRRTYTGRNDLRIAL